MKKKCELIYGLLDCNNFYVSCERVFQPKLEQRPVVVLSNNDGCVISRSNEAKALKIKMAQPIFQVKDLIRHHQVKCLSSNYTLYADLSRRVMEAISELVPAFEIYSIDEAFLDLSGIPPKELSALGKKIVETVLQWTGIPVSLGIGPTKTLAKVANHLAKKNREYQNVFILNEENRDLCLAQTPVEEIWGIGRKWSKKINDMGINNAYQLSQECSERIRKMSNKMLAATVAELRGHAIQDIEKTIQPRKQIIVSRSFGRPVNDLKELKEAVSFHLTRAMEKLRSQNSVAQCLTVFIQTNRFQASFQNYHHQINLELPLPSHDTQEFIKMALPAVERLFCKGLNYKKAGVVLSEISQKNEGQFDLFEASLEKTDKFMGLLDHINQKMGQGKLRYAIEGYEKDWQMQSSHRSPCYTTRWDDLPVVKAI